MARSLGAWLRPVKPTWLDAEQAANRETLNGAQKILTSALIAQSSAFRYSGKAEWYKGRGSADGCSAGSWRCGFCREERDGDMLMVDTKGQGLPHLYVRNSDL